MQGASNVDGIYITVNSEIFARVYSHMRSFAIRKPSRNGEITLLFADIIKACLSREFLTSQIHVCLSTLFAKIKPSRNGEITLLFTDIFKACLSREFLTSQICLSTLFAKIKFSRKFPNLHYGISFRFDAITYSIDPYVTPQWAASHLGRHCLR